MAGLERASDVDAAEGDAASLRVAVGRLPVGSFVRTRVEAALDDIDRDVAAARATVTAAPARAPVAAAGLERAKAAEARRRISLALERREAPPPRTPAEALALALHALLAPALRCVGAPPNTKVVVGFAPSERELERGKLLPHAWNDRGDTGACAAFKYRPVQGGAPGRPNLPLETYEMTCVAASPETLHVTLATAKRGVLHADELRVDRYAPSTTELTNLDELCDYVDRVVSTGLAVAAETAAPARAATSPLSVPPHRGDAWSSQPARDQFRPPGPARPAPLIDSRAPFFDGGMLVGPDHFGAPPAGRHPFAPRFDPITPGGLPGFGDPLGGGLPGFGDPRIGQPRRPRGAPRLPGEPDFDHLRPPGANDDDMFL